MKSIIKNFRWQRTFIILVGMGTLSTMSFNCAPSLFESADYSYLSLRGPSPDLFEAPKDSPWVLQNTYQVYQSMANVTGQAGAISGNQLAEYDIRAGALGGTDKITDINAPMQLAATSLAGEFCNGLINNELNAPNRQYFSGVNFGANIGGNTTQAYADSIEAMALGFWGREIKPEEIAILTTYYNDFVSVAGAGGQVRPLYLATCAAMLASFDALTY